MTKASQIPEDTDAVDVAPRDHVGSHEATDGRFVPIVSAPKALAGAAGL